MVHPSTDTNDMKTNNESATPVRYENQRDQIERLLAMPDEYPACVRSKYVREVYGSGAALVFEDGKYEIAVRF